MDIYRLYYPQPAADQSPVINLQKHQQLKYMNCHLLVRVQNLRLFVRFAKQNPQEFYLSELLCLNYKVLRNQPQLLVYREQA